jgi:hypothetical protein
MREHVVLMHAMGYRYNTQAERLLRLDRFLQGRPDLSGHPLTELIREWTNTRSTPQQGVALILDIDLKLREQPSVAGEVSIL